MSDQTVTQRPLWVTVLMLVISAAMLITFVMLGNWQVRRLHWKVDLIDAVEARAHGQPVSIPQTFDPDAHNYLRVVAEGRFLPDKIILVKAVTELGLGHWVMMPMKTQQGLLWVNRGFVLPKAKDAAQWSLPTTPVTGLLRPSESGRTALETNDPANKRWVSRDTAALSAAVGLDGALPFFLDADHMADPGEWPRGGMTIITFRNSHLSYALTWYAMAVLFFAALVYVAYSARSERAKP